MSDWLNRDYLVFEAMTDPQPAYTCHWSAFALAGHVRAESAVEAAKVFAGVNKRVCNYAVVEATMVNLAASNAPGFDLTDDVSSTPHRS